jgi:hypothetical protein
MTLPFDRHCLLLTKMKLNEYSSNKLRKNAKEWFVSEDHFGVLYNYLVFGFNPGSFWTSVLANNFMNAISHSHPSNSIADLKNTIHWIISHFPLDSFGSYEKVTAWLELPELDRRKQLEDAKMIYTTKEELVLTLKDAPLVRG